MKRRTRPNSLNTAHYDLVNLVQDFKQRVCERMQWSEFAYYYRIRSKTKLAKMDEETIAEIKKAVLAGAIQGVQEPIINR